MKSRDNVKKIPLGHAWLHLKAEKISRKTVNKQSKQWEPIPLLFFKEMLDKAEKDLYEVLASGASSLHTGGSLERSSTIVECLQNQDSHNKVMRMSAWADLLEGEHETLQRHTK